MSSNLSHSNIKQGTIILLAKDIKYKTTLLNDLVRSNHMFYVLARKDDYILICPLSSNQNKMDIIYPENVILNDWEDIGLKKKSYVSTDTRGWLSIDYVIKVITKATIFDRKAIQLQSLKTKLRQKLESIYD